MRAVLADKNPFFNTALDTRLEPGARPAQYVVWSVHRAGDAVNCHPDNACAALGRTCCDNEWTENAAEASAPLAADATACGQRGAIPFCGRLGGSSQLKRLLSAMAPRQSARLDIQDATNLRRIAIDAASRSEARVARATSHLPHAWWLIPMLPTGICLWAVILWAVGRVSGAF
jgi:hypothetical protein